MYWDIVALNKRYKSIVYIWLAYVAIMLAWTFFAGDLSQVQAFGKQPWITNNQTILKWLSDNSMYPLYVVFIGLIIVGKFKQIKHFSIVGWGYFLAQLLGSVAIVRTLKMTLGHARPDQMSKLANDVLDTWVGPTTSSGYHGFPSGHTSDFLISGIFIAMLLPKWWMRLLAMAFALFNGILRIALNKHFPLDVLGGAIIGGSVALLVWRYWVNPRLSHS
jgi:membrane-associated phospholipid phosphatase